MRDTRLKLDELLLKRAVGALTAAEVYERAAAVVCLAALDTREALPDTLRSKLERQAAAFVAGARTRD